MALARLTPRSEAGRGFGAGRERDRGAIDDCGDGYGWREEDLGKAKRQDRVITTRSRNRPSKMCD
jgi:hypothetical protein